MSAGSLEADAAARAEVRTRIDENLFVEAGAGTGKTSALVDRFVALILAGRPVEELVAITFTERAAAELTERVRAELERRQRENDGDPALIVQALESLDRAEVSTIHAFCRRALLLFAAEAAIDPAFGVEDEVNSERRFQERWRDCLDDLALDPVSQAAVNRVLDLGLWPRDLEGIVRALGSAPDLASRLEKTPLVAPALAWPDFAALKEELASVDVSRVPDSDNLLQTLHKYSGLLDQLKAAETPESVLASWAGDLQPKLGNTGRAANWRDADIKTVRETLTGVCGALDGALNRARAQALAALLPYLTRFVTAEQKARGEDGALTFDDLVLKLRNLLHDFPSTAEVLRRRYSALLIDEFQDTDPLQMDIALAFATDPATGRLEPGRLFLVGDPKQSIYRFRRADMAIYADVFDRVTHAGGRFPRLALNRRSRREVVEWVNTVFEPMIGGGEAPSLQPPYRPIGHLREEGLAGPGVAYIGEEVEGLNARGVRRLEAEEVAAHCRAAVLRGWQVVDRAGGTVRPARYRDIAVLVPSRPILSHLERALTNAGVPYRVEGGSLVYGTQEVRDLINCLTAIDDPADEVAVVGALRSTAYACSDRELFVFTGAGGRFDYLDRRLDDRDGRVAEALRNLRWWHRERRDLSLAALTERFINERRVVEVGVYAEGGRNPFRRARFLVEQARAFEASGPQSLRAFVNWLERRAGEAILDDEGAGLDDDEDALRILTVHGAKGLEFPIVFLAGLGMNPPADRSVFLVDRASGAVAVRVGAGTRNNLFCLGDVETARAREAEHAKAEQARLLYVAATRARDHLIVSLYHQARYSHASGARRLLQAGAMQAAHPLLIDVNLTASPRGPFDGVEIHEPPERFAEEREVLVERLRPSDHVSATALGRAVRDAADDSEAEREDETEPWARGRGGTRVGRAVHAALQGLPLDADAATIAAYARAQALAEAVPERTAEVERLLRVALNTEVAARARQARRALREVPYALEVDGVVLEGFIDMVIENEDGLEIVDWKTDHIAPELVEERLREYRLQAGLYVHGLGAATGLPVSRVTYVFVAADRAVSPGEPAALASAALERLREGWARAT